MSFPLIRAAATIDIRFECLSGIEPQNWFYDISFSFIAMSLRHGKNKVGTKKKIEIFVGVQLQYGSLEIEQ